VGFGGILANPQPEVEAHEGRSPASGRRSKTRAHRDTDAEFGLLALATTDPREPLYVVRLANPVSRSG
jgi:hypothetical protein